MVASRTVEARGTATKIDATTHLQDGYEPAPMPPPAPDGGPVLPAARSLRVIREVALCDQGPCRYQHVHTGKVDAQMPLDGSPLVRPKLDAFGEPIRKATEPDGTPIWETEEYTPKERIRSCYPAAGVVLELSADEPITECNRWDPEDDFDYQIRRRDQRRAKFRQRMSAASPASESSNTKG